MMKRLFFVSLLTLLSVAAFSQSYGEDGYTYYYDYDHRVVVRSCIACNMDYQDLWNGDYVRVISDYVYIYRDGKRVLYGNKVWLEHTGDYTVQLGDYLYLYDSDGRRKGPYGQMIYALWNGCYTVKQSGYWYLYDNDGDRISGIYSSGDYDIKIFWNGYYLIKQGEYYYVYKPDGTRLSAAYSTEEPLLMNSGSFRCLQGGYYNLIDTDGRRVH